jgi:hypothetical protein
MLLVNSVREYTKCGRFLGAIMFQVDSARLTPRHRSRLYAVVLPLPYHHLVIAAVDLLSITEGAAIHTEFCINL